MYKVYSRAGEERSFILESERDMTVKCYNTVYFRFGKEGDEITMVDPDGGPMIAVNKVIHIGDTRYMIYRINGYEKDEDDTLVIRVSVVRVD